MIVGIDYSYTSPAICILGEDFKSSKFFFCNQNKKVCVKAHNYEGTLLTKDYKHDCERYDRISDWAIETITKHMVGQPTIILEGYAFGARGGMLFNIAENAGLLKYKLAKEFSHPIIVSPTSVKKFWTGKGNSNKEAMVQTLLDKEGIDIVQWLQMNKLGSPAHDIVDSYAIALFGKEQK